MASGYTHTQTHAWPHESDFKKPGTHRPAPGLKPTKYCKILTLNCMQIILSVSYTEAHQQDQLNLFWDQTDKINNI